MNFIYFQIIKMKFYFLILNHSAVLNIYFLISFINLIDQYIIVFIFLILINAQILLIFLTLIIFLSPIFEIILYF